MFYLMDFNSNVYLIPIFFIRYDLFKYLHSLKTTPIFLVQETIKSFVQLHVVGWLSVTSLVLENWRNFLYLDIKSLNHTKIIFLGCHDLSMDD